MKKAYNAPKIYIERFEMTEHIAACGSTTQANANNFGKPNATEIMTCEFVSHNGLVRLFSTGLGGNSDCNENYDESWEQMVGCYNSPTGDNIIFAS